MHVKIENGKVVRYPYGLEELRHDHPGVGFPDKLPKATLRRFGVHKVVHDPKPHHDTLVEQATPWPLPQRRLYRCFYWEGNEEWEPGRDWVLGWNVTRLPKQEAAANVRQRRTALLLESDWTQMVDAPVDQAAWATYRQALRDLPQQNGFPYSVEWPTKPG